MNFVIPMAGRGSRFQKKGYAQPKYLIEVNGKSLLQYSLESLPLNLATKLIFILLKEHQTSFDVIAHIRREVPNKVLEFVVIDEVTRGQGETVLLSKPYVDMDKDLLVFNIDTHFKSEGLTAVLSDEKRKKDGVLGAFHAEGTHWSFAELNEQQVVVKTAEKERISENALTGLYHFTNPDDFFSVAAYCIERGITDKNEFYIAPMYNQLIANGKEFVLDFVSEFIPLGTPEEVEQYKAKL